MGGVISTQKILVGKPEVKRQRARFRRWQDNIEMNLKYVEWEIFLRQGPVTGSSKHGNEPSVSIKGWEYFQQLNVYQVLNMNSIPGSKLRRAMCCYKVLRRAYVKLYKCFWEKLPPSHLPSARSNQSCIRRTKVTAWNRTMAGIWHRILNMGRGRRHKT